MIIDVEKFFFSQTTFFGRRRRGCSGTGEKQKQSDSDDVTRSGTRDRDGRCRSVRAICKSRKRSKERKGAKNNLFAFYTRARLLKTTGPRGESRHAATATATTTTTTLIIPRRGDKFAVKGTTVSKARPVAVRLFVCNSYRLVSNDSRATELYRRDRRHYRPESSVLRLSRASTRLNCIFREEKKKSCRSK